MQRSVSIIIPCYNAERFLSETLDNALAELPGDGEIICVNDGSKDGTQSILESYGEKLVVISGERKGANAARNKALSIAKGKYIKLLDADDLLVPGALAEQIQRSDSLPAEERSLFFGRVIQIDETGATIGNYPMRGPMPEEENLLFLLAASPITSCPLHRADWIREVGGLNEEIPTAHEHDLHLRLGMKGIQFLDDESPIYYYREHGVGDRITSDPFAHGDPLFYLSYYREKREELARYFEPRDIPSAYDQVIAESLWKAGRWAARHVREDVAKRYFECARSIFPRLECPGTFGYRTLLKFTGPYFAERLLLKVRG